MAGAPVESHGFGNSPTQPTPRPHRVVVVGESNDARILCEQLTAHGITCAAVPTYLAALGALSTDKSDWLIGPADAWQGSPRSIVQSARALSPDIRMIALCDPNHGASESDVLAAGFDSAWPAPLKRDSIDRLLGQSDTAPEPVPAQPAPQQEQEQEQELGDIDLADALLDVDGDVAHVALRMIESYSGLAQVGLRPADGEAPQGHQCVQVRYQGRCLGLLHAPPPATDEALAPWAEWLGRWLALRDQTHELRDMALRDELTGLWNRRYFNRFLDRILKKAARDRSQVTLLVFDIDDFKLYNDKYGHGTGDEVLREAARLMLSVVREHDVVARIGGDEFAVIFWDNEKPRKPNSEHPNDVVTAARRFQEAICSHRFPKLMNKAIGRLTVSGGLASFPWDGRTPQELLTRADAMALQSKRQGKNAICFGTGNKRARE